MSNFHQRKALRVERLESRAMLAGDLRCDHNAMLPEDANGNGDVSALDALVVINELARSRVNPQGSSQTSLSPRGNMVDVNADGKATAADALVVINRIARERRDGSTESRVSMADRISRLESDIEAGTLPTNLDIVTAKALLVRMQAIAPPQVQATPAVTSVDKLVTGGSGDVAVDDTDTVDDGGNPDNGMDGSDDSVDDSNTDETAGDETDSGESPDGSDDDAVDEGADEIDDGSGDGTTDGGDDDGGVEDGHDCPDSAAHLTRLSERLSQRLAAAGVSAEVVTNVTDAFALAITAGEPLTRADVLKILSDAGVDATVLETLALAGPDGEPNKQGVRIDRLEKKLLENGNDPVVVQTLVAEIKAAVDAGTPLTSDEIKARIEALGLTLPTREQHSPIERFAHLSELLLQNDNDPKVVDGLITELVAAVEAGWPLSRAEVKARIDELGLTFPERVEPQMQTQMLGRLQVARDAYFTMLAAAGR